MAHFWNEYADLGIYIKKNRCVKILDFDTPDYLILF